MNYNYYKLLSTYWIY